MPNPVPLPIRPIVGLLELVLGACLSLAGVSFFLMWLTGCGPGCHDGVAFLLLGGIALTPVGIALLVSGLLLRTERPRAGWAQVLIPLTLVATWLLLARMLP